VHSTLAPETVAPSAAEQDPARRHLPAPPRALVWVSAAVVAAGVAMGVAGALKTGISWDEPFHVMRLRNFFEHGWYALDWSLGGESGSGSGPGSSENNTSVYGPVAALLVHGLAALVGVEDWDSVATTPGAYDARHVGVLLIGLIGTAAAASITRALLGSWRWALVTAATLLALPMWTGHLMFNIKDVPVATGYTLMTLALVAMVVPVRGRRMLRIGGLAAGVVLMVGTRPGMAIAVLIGLGVLAAGLLATGRFGDNRTAFAEAAVGSVLGYGALALIYPNAFLHPGGLLRSAEQSGSFRGGRDAAYGYVPFYMIAQVPLLLQICFAVGLVASIRFVLRRWRTETSQVTRLTLVGAQVAALPLIAIAGHSDLYNGLRQLLFASPAWAVLATIGLARLLAWGREHGRPRVIAGLALVALVAPMVDQGMLFPYQYTYYNAALDATGESMPSDYWRVSVPELLPHIPTDAQVVCGPTRSAPITTTGEVASVPEKDKLAGRYSSDSSVDCRTDPLGPLASAWTAEELPQDDTLPRDQFYAVIDRDHPLPANCNRLVQVTRNRHGREIPMTYLARCHLDAPVLESDPVAFVQTADEPNMTADLWAYAPRGWLMRTSWTAIDAADRVASLTFRAPSVCAHQACSLVLDGDAPEDLTATVNDSGTGVRATRGSVAVLLPPGTTTSWVTFSRNSGEPLHLRVRSIRIALPENP
jgi:hypothetical protein